MTVSQ